jgi:alkylhydroperoxidase/carboxymuconolactone decarboxylase family protein YurZ
MAMAEDPQQPIVSERGRRAANEMFGPGGDEHMEANAQRWVRRVDADWARIINAFIINGLYSRDVLPTSTRELCAVAALTVLQRTEELTTHIRIALRSNPPEQVREVILQMAVYGGMPVALDAMRVFEAVTAGTDDDGAAP